MSEEEEERWYLVDDALVDLILAVYGACGMRTADGFDVWGDWADGGAAAVVLAEELWARGLVLSRLEANVRSECVKVTFEVHRAGAKVVRLPVFR